MAAPLFFGCARSEISVAEQDMVRGRDAAHLKRMLSPAPPLLLLSRSPGCLHECLDFFQGEAPIFVDVH
jgi:hypothetical protein